ncbi:MAG TPA: 4Fe-4S dicluster domain-containing protein [Anaerolineae bacterium]|nr:4Fe-4S dicluster domain-containing protein [Anaerolineae bacterium]
MIESLASKYGLYLCVECGKCVAICPMGEIYTHVSYEISPRGIIERILLDPEIPEDDCLWFCLTCDLCTNLCPAGVRFRDFVEVARQVAIKNGITEYSSFCDGCGTYLYPEHILGYLKQELGETAEELLTLCPRCRRYDFGEKLKAQIPGKRKVGSLEVETGDSR